MAISLSCRNLDHKTKLKLYLVLLPIVAVVIWLVQVGTGAIMSRESAAFLSSFTVVTTVVAFVAFLCTFILTGTLILVGHADARGELAQVGKLIVWSSVFGFVVGGLGGIYVFADADTLIETFDPKGQLVNETKQTLLIFTIGFPFLVYCYGLAASLFALLYIGPMVAGLGVVALVFVGVSYGMFFGGAGLQSFGYGFDLAVVTFALMMSLYMYGSQERRNLYQFPLCSGTPVAIEEEESTDTVEQPERIETDNNSIFSFEEMSFREVLVEFITSFGMLSLRSLCLNCQKLVSAVLLVRIGVVEAAIYVLLGNLRSITSNVTTVCAFLINFVGSRIYGAGDASHIAADFRGFLAISKFSVIFTTLFGTLLAVVYGIIGRDIVVRQAADDERTQYEELLTPVLILLFASFQISSSMAGVLEAVLLTAKDFNYVGTSVVIAFLAGYIPLLIIGYEQSSLTMIYAGDVVFFWIRTVFAFIRWFWFKKPGLIEQNHIADYKLSKDASYKEKAIFLVCCGHGLADWNAIVDALTRDPPKPKRPLSTRSHPPPEL